MPPAAEGPGRDRHLAVYGTLAPGEPNHHQLAGLTGTWMRGTVRGVLVAQGWAATLGYPALTLTADGEAVAVEVFASPDLPAHWPRLDAFEGDGYRRAPVEVATAAGPVPAWIYTAAEPVA